MTLILYNGYVIEMDRNYILSEIETVLPTADKIAELVENLTDENLSDVTYSGQSFFNLVCDNVMVLNTNPTSAGYRVRIHLHQKTEQELYAEAGRILLGELDENTNG